MSNIKVCVKIRPLSQHDIKLEKEEEWKVTDNKSLQCVNISHPCDFAFDHIFGTKSLNYEVYVSFVRPIVDSCLAGFKNGTILTYGPTSAGKNHTLLGTDMDPGIILITIERLFKSDGVFHRTIRFGYIEIYKEKVYDLLNDRKPVTIDHNHTDITLSNDEIVVENFDKVIDILLNGSYKRKSSTDDDSKLSSLSHSIFRITICSENKTNGTMQTSYLSFVHVGACEPISDSLEDESSKSLHWFKVVIDRLNKGERNIDFNNSILTMLVRESLTGKSNTAIVCNVKADEVMETTSTLKFASRAKNVRTIPIRNEQHNVQARSSIPVVDAKTVHMEHQLKEIANTKVENLLLRKELEEVRAAFAVKTTWFEEQMKSAEFAQQQLKCARIEETKSFERIQNGLTSKIKTLTVSNEYLRRKLEDLHPDTGAHHSLFEASKSPILSPSGKSILTENGAKHLEKQEINAGVKAGIKRKIELLANEWTRQSKMQKSELHRKTTDVKRTTKRTRTLSNDETESHTTTVPNSLIGRVIGHKGAKLQSLKSVTGARISISERNKDLDRIVTINGNKSSVRMAVDMIQQTLNLTD